jgi:vacuolar protein sorting-associated protein 18
LVRVKLNAFCVTVELELQKKHGENKKINKIFLDTHGDHLFVNTEVGETYYLGTRNARVGKGRPIARLNNIHIESIAWNVDATTNSTKEILIGTRDGLILETYLEISDHIPNARYVRQLRNYATPIIGLYVEKSGDSRDVFIASRSGITIYSGRIAKKPVGDISSIYANFFDDSNSGQFQDLRDPTFSSRVSVLPRSSADTHSDQTHAYFAWATSSGLFHGNMYTAKSHNDDSIFSDATLVPYSSLFSSMSEGKPILPELSQFHVLLLYENQLVAINRLNNRVAFEGSVPSVFFPSENLFSSPETRRKVLWNRG